jgi:gas vesicle protein
MENQTTTTAGQGMGIAGLLLGIIAIPLAIIPCTFVLALLFGAAGIVLSAVGLHQANTSNGTKGLPLSGLIVSVVGLCIAMMWGFFFASLSDNGRFWKQGKFWEQFENIGNEVGKDIEESMKDVEDDFDKAGKDLEKTLEELESDSARQNFIWGEEISNEEFDKLLNSYEELIGDYVKLVDDAGDGDIEAIAEYAKVSVKAVALATKLTSVAPKLTEKQKERFKELQKKYEETLEKAEDK